MEAHLLTVTATCALLHLRGETGGTFGDLASLVVVFIMGGRYGKGCKGCSYSVFDGMKPH